MNKTTPSTARVLLSKVPEVTVFFWIIKIPATTIGETAADHLADNIGLGLAGTTWVMSAALVVILVQQRSPPGTSSSASTSATGRRR